MAIGFDPHNLDAAVSAVIDEAARREQRVYIDKPTQRVDLTDREQVRAYLKRRVQAAYTRAKASPEGVQIARIEDIPYRGIGFVFEPHQGEMHPPPEAVEEGVPVAHLAYFWANLSQ